MAKIGQIYRCNICGNIVELVHAGKGSLVCCNQKMELLTENSVDAAKEKHVPVIENNGDKVIVKIGEMPHPMEEKHYIEWIELVADDDVQRVFLKPGDGPAAKFNTVEGKEYFARAYCNLHGLWKSA